MPVMSARIAPEPIHSGLGAIADYRSRSLLGDSYSGPEQDAPPPPVSDDVPAFETAPVPPTPPSPPGSAFAAALLSGQLPQRLRSQREIRLRLGRAELPAQGSLALHDRRV